MTVSPKPSLAILPLLSLTSLLALSAGIGLGIALRSESAAPSQTRLLNSEQSFPPQADWPISAKYSAAAGENAE